MGKVIFNADDFGYSRGINYAIADCHELGILTSTTIMANMPGFDHAVSLAKVLPRLGIGVHLTLTCGPALLKGHQTIVDEQGYFKPLYYFEKENPYDTNEIYHEWKAQIEKVMRAGIKPTHLDSHHHVHTLEPIQAIIVKLAREYQLPVRNNFKLPEDVSGVKRFEPFFDSVGIDSEEHLEVYLNNLLDDIQAWETVEVMCHPGYLDHEVYSGSKLTENRAHLAFFMIHSNFTQELKQNPNIDCITYRDL